MTARILPFPIVPAQRSATVIARPILAQAWTEAVPTAIPPIGATGLANKFVDHFLPVVQASVDLLSADEADFEARCRGMLDGDGTAMIDELRTVGRQMQVLVDGLDLTRARLRTAMARLAAPLDARFEESS